MNRRRLWSLACMEEQLAELPARTPEGIQAKAEALRDRLLSDADEAESELMSEDDALAWPWWKTCWEGHEPWPSLLHSSTSGPYASNSRLA